MAILRTTKIFSDSVITLFAVESVDTWHNKTSTGCQLYGGLTPVAIIVRGPDRTDVIDMEARPVDLAQIRQDVPGLDAILRQ